MRIKRDKADELFSLMVRERDGYRCQFCLKQYEPGDRGLQCSHFWGRGNKTTRFDPQNGDALCYYCHATHEGNKQGFYREWKTTQLGAGGYARLERRARAIGKYGAFEKEAAKQELARQKKLGLHLKKGWVGFPL